MSVPALLTISDAFVAFGQKVIFESLSFNIHEGNKICLVGKNGAGKTTLMNIITGDCELDSGKRTKIPGITIGHLQQEIYPDGSQSLFDYVISGLPEKKQTEDNKYLVEIILEALQLHADDIIQNLSGGQLRRAALAYTLVEDKDILLLDEPTNHLDLETIQWLESYLQSYRGTFICISHDRTFLSNITNTIFWLDRGKVRVCPEGFAHFSRWSQMMLDQEARELAKRGKQVAQEVAWASSGVKARRKRNERRVAEMKAARQKLKEDQSSYRQVTRKIKLEASKEEESSKVIAEFYKVSKSFEDKNKTKKIIDQFSLKVVRGDRIGLIGKNGSGKTTFLKLMIKEMMSDQGSVKLANNIKISYFDQKREDLNPKNTLWKTLCPGGGEYIEVGGKVDIYVGI